MPDLRIPTKNLHQLVSTIVALETKLITHIWMVVPIIMTIGYIRYSITM